VFPKIEVPLLKSKIKAIVKERYPRLSKLMLKFKHILEKITTARPISRFRKVASGISVCYLTNNFPQRPPARGEYASGGGVKMLYLAEAFPHSFPSANILYTVSSVGHPETVQIVARAKQKHLKIIVNQNGVAYPAWHGPGWENTNHRLSATLEQADYIVYQSRFCQVGAERFLFPPNVPREILYNPVDVKLFAPIAYSLKPKNLTLLLGGNQNERYRLELAIRTLKVVTRANPDARLVVTGHLWKPEEDAINWTRNLLKEMDLLEKVTFTGNYTQEQAPPIFSQAQILLHTQYNDASPTLVLEAMASGLPVVYIDSGGVPELVAEAGIGVPVEHSWDQVNLPEPDVMGNAVVRIMSGYRDFSNLARARAVNLFSLEVFLEKHRQIFEKVLSS
jgi:glycosyltransferase involved in cell wall biosynthesis